VDLLAGSFLARGFQLVDMGGGRVRLSRRQDRARLWRGRRAQTRKPRTKYGYYLNFEQAVTDDIGVFGRWSWNNGKNEIAAFTDIDASLSLGASIRGTRWGRPDDRIGLAGAINSLSRDHRDYIAAGGLGILIGDGQLNYRPETILETFTP
jgi:high affinity Mn2+ porin